LICTTEETTMRKLTSLALVAALGLGAAALSKPADAGVVVGVGLPGVAVVAPPVVAPAPVVAPVGFYYRYPHFYPGWYGGRYGYGWHRGWYHGHYWR
jgi:hypothetical protein